MRGGTVAEADANAAAALERSPADALDEGRVLDRVGHGDPLDVESGRDLRQVVVERLLGRERSDGE